MYFCSNQNRMAPNFAAITDMHQTKRNSFHRYHHFILHYVAIVPIFFSCSYDLCLPNLYANEFEKNPGFHTHKIKLTILPEWIAGSIHYNIPLCALLKSEESDFVVAYFLWHSFC